MSQWRLSAGTAAVIGKKILKAETAPTTAYLMLGEKCRHNCCFCAQARSSAAGSDRLSRIIWPSFASETVAPSIIAACASGELKRICLQVVHNEDSWQNTLAALQELGASPQRPVCVSGNVEKVAQVQTLLAVGAARVCIALDAATPELDREVKDGAWEKKWSLLQECAAAFPERITTHLIVGLGETEEAMRELLAECVARRIAVGLFAFTPVRGTAWAGRQPPAIGRYRRIQIAHWVLRQGFPRQVIECEAGGIVKIAVPKLRALLADGKAFETSGCPDCNRPFYNERPGGVIYNYPRPLTTDEVNRAISASGLPI